MKNKFVVFILLLISIISIYVVPSLNESNTNNKLDTYVNHVENFEVTFDENIEIISYALNEDIFYYAYSQSSKNDLKSNIIINSFDLNSEEIKNITKFTIGDSDFFSELVISDDLLFWVIEDTVGGWSINKYGLKTKIFDVIRDDSQSKSTLPICLNASDNYITWFEYDMEHNNDTAELYSYYIKNEEIVLISNKIKLFTPYDRTYIRNDSVTFVEEILGNVQLVNYSLTDDIELSKIEIDRDLQVLNPVTLNEITVWHDGFGESKIYI